MQEIICVLKNVRTEKGMTQMSLSRATGIAQTVISGYENGHRQPNIETLFKLGPALGVPWHELVEPKVV